MLKLLLLSISLSFTFFSSAMAGPFDNIKTYNRDDYSREITQCDILASHFNDPERITDGVTQNDMDKPAAIKACLEAVANDTENPRLNYQLARAYAYSGLHEESDPYRIKALNAGYPQSLFVIGYIRLEGWDGRGSDACYGGELIRRSAHAGRFAGLVGFPHYFQMGKFENCTDYPVINKDEINSFLEKAQKSTDDYYHLILIDNLKNGMTK